MTISRYSFVTNRKNSLGEKLVTNSVASTRIYNAVNNQTISYNIHILEEGERLDYLAGLFYNNSSLWWVLAAASGIGYALQVPPGTIIRVPNNISEVLGLLM